MAMELFGAGIAPHAAVACMVSFLIVGYRSIYPSQLLGMHKSTSLKVETGNSIGEFEYAKIDHRRTSLLGFVEKVMKRGRRDNKKR